ncbi:hypothetical protein Bca101_046111 [Brassica carinata]
MQLHKEISILLGSYWKRRAGISSLSPCYNKDICLWISDSLKENNFREVVRGVSWDLVKFIDSFTNKKWLTSHSYRIVFRSMERSLTRSMICR